VVSRTGPPLPPCMRQSLLFLQALNDCPVRDNMAIVPIALVRGLLSPTFYLFSTIGQAF